MPFKTFALRFAGALLFNILAVFAPSAVYAQQDDEYAGLAEAPGREEVATYCGACHSLNLVAQQGLDRQRWDDLLVLMVEEHGMPELEPDERKMILDYLAAKVGPEDQKERLRQRGLRN